MGQLVSDAESTSLLTWAAAQRRAGPRRFRVEPGGLRFAFYGRISTTDHQDYGSSRHWQLSAATELIAGHGDIAAEYFDAGVSRRTAWSDRVEAARLLTDIRAADRGFDALVVGEYERAFQGRQLEELTPILRRHHVGLWLPETYGPVNFDSPRQLALLDLLGVRSQREVVKARYRVIAGDARANRNSGPSSRWPAALRLPAGRRRSPSKSCTCRMGSAFTPPGA